MNKTTTYVLIGAAVLVGIYLVASKSSPLLLGSSTATTGGASYISASGSAANGFANLWATIAGSGSGSGSGGYVPNITRGEDTDLSGAY